jgi:hypothetical protein
MNGKLQVIQACYGKVKMDYAVCFNWEVFKEARTPPQQVFCYLSYSEEVPFGRQLIEIFYIW